jgi:hypothetical protein
VTLLGVLRLYDIYLSTLLGVLRIYDIYLIGLILVASLI